jgi:Relaxase/Mobilisation nuclease domain
VIVKIMSNGTSFSGAAAYLTHDANHAKTAERVEWTHTLNLASDDVPGAVNEMLWTARDAELLKQQAGIRAGGRATENTVKTLSLNWSPEDEPTREHMVQTTQDFLRNMGWDSHQAILVSHTDKPYAHVHVVLNTVHPETGLKLDDGFERRRAMEWAAQYEIAQDRVYCEQRLKNAEEREKSPPRNIWMAFQQNEKEFEKSEKSLEKNQPIFVDEPKNLRNSEWNILKENQRAGRLEFFAEGKSEFKELRNSIYREIREEFRERWADYYQARKDGADPESVAALKASLIADQKTVLETRRDEACKELRETRDHHYRELLAGQREERAELRWRQEVGLDNAAFLNEAGDRNAASKEMTAGFREAANEVTLSYDRGAEDLGARYARGLERDEPDTIHGADRAPDIGDRIGSGVISFFDSLGYDLVNLGSARPVPAPKTDSFGRRFIDIAAEEATKDRLRHDRERDDEEWRGRQRSPHGD